MWTDETNWGTDETNFVRRSYFPFYSNRSTKDLSINELFFSIF